MQWSTTAARRGAVPLLVRRKMNGCSLFGCWARSNRLCGNDAGTVALLRRSFQSRQQPLRFVLRQSAFNHLLRHLPLAIKLVAFGKVAFIQRGLLLRCQPWLS